MYQTIPKMYPKDIRLFRLGSEWFEACLEGTKDAETGEQLVIKQYKVIEYLIYHRLLENIFVRNLSLIFKEKVNLRN